MPYRKKHAGIKIIVDTNIVFSGILNSSGKIGKILTGSKNYFRLYSCNFLRDEIQKHRGKIQRLTGLQLREIEELETLVTKNISFISEGLIPEKIINKTKILLTGIDINDTPFVALTKHLGAKLWTGDKQLIQGLKSKRFRNVITTNELAEMQFKFESKRI